MAPEVAAKRRLLHRSASHPPCSRVRNVSSCSMGTGATLDKYLLENLTVGLGYGAAITSVNESPRTCHAVAYTPRLLAHTIW
jgi:hypothetical protein